ncbi:hypothetical protein [Tsuneonella mangrovi]|uniref:hypothetical protein n=1 Tax=Tsuneonella mangrovi TaxID=1982042 RepID=UPI000BA21E9F|nr:hypothetical protein [Tsuneonella mangrovi]
MSANERQMAEDKALRDAARALVMADVAHIKTDLAQRGIGARVADRIGDGAVDVFKEAVEVAEDNRGALAAIFGALVLWFSRNPIMTMFSSDEPGEGSDHPPRAKEPHSPAER